ncbi:hypothetical protein FQA39_LY06790 [Lamprigera yunnana]|nr:hypothetical protein FQA39_LY06790 [Lamprigera yunnana]
MCKMSLLSCPLCSKPHFEGVSSLRTTLISAATTNIPCPVCNELLLGLDKLTIHLFSHIGDNKVLQTKNMDLTSLPEDMGDENALKCDICNFEFSDSTILELHRQLLHQTLFRKHNKYNYNCHLCQKQFRMRGSLMIHLRVAHFNYLQSNCRKVNTDITNDVPQLQNAEKRKGVQDKNWECDVCSKLFTTKYFLKKHKRLHTGEMPYYCSQCNKYFTFQQSYHKHMLYHTDNKPHTCAECGRAFKELSTLHNHQRIHSGERPFHCETCGKSFRQRVSYLVHCRIHTGVMPYKCDTCNKSFRYKVSLRSHKCIGQIPNPIEKISDLVEKLNQNEIVNFSEQVLSNPTQCSSDVLLDKTPQNLDSSDFFNIILSPVVTEVQSLHLSNYSILEESNKTEVNSLETINEDSFKELIYGVTQNF